MALVPSRLRALGKLCVDGCHVRFDRRADRRPCGARIRPGQALQPRDSAWIRRGRRKMSAGSSSLSAVESSDPGSPPADGSRHALFRYLTAEESADYLAIMELFSATLLTDLSAAEVSAQLAERGLTLDRDVVEARCRQLVAWGNLVPSIRDAKLSTVAEYIRSRSRYQVSKLGGRLHREARLRAHHPGQDILRHGVFVAQKLANECLLETAAPNEILAGHLAEIQELSRRGGTTGQAIAGLPTIRECGVASAIEYQHEPELPRGALIAFTGDSGSGKSTLLLSWAQRSAQPARLS